MHRCHAALQVGVVSGEKPLALYTTVGRGASDGERVDLYDDDDLNKYCVHYRWG